MATADSFAALGLYVRRGFLDPQTSERLRSAVKIAPTSEATVRTDDREYSVDRSTRSTDWADVVPELVGPVTERLTAAMPEVSQHYGIPLVAVQQLQFLVYREGDFFERHRDRGVSSGASPSSHARRVAAVIFLNGAGDPTSDGYRGGELTLYGLFDQPDSEALGVPLEAEEGLLVTFPADVVHEVRRVEAGKRFTVVTWFE
jgi:predicted 2-oxoglutarate/Fe(II)-dependent dioxygenase YbiX